MTRLTIAIGIVTMGLAAAAPARADFAVIKFRDSGSCRAWIDAKAKPTAAHQVLWARVPTLEAAQAKGAWAVHHRWCKSWI